MAGSSSDQHVATTHLRRAYAAAVAVVLRLVPPIANVPLGHSPFVSLVFEIVCLPRRRAVGAFGPHCDLVQRCVDLVGIGLGSDVGWIVGSGCAKNAALIRNGHVHSPHIWKPNWIIDVSVVWRNRWQYGIDTLAQCQSTRVPNAARNKNRYQNRLFAATHERIGVCLAELRRCVTVAKANAAFRRDDSVFVSVLGCIQNSRCANRWT